MSNTVGRKSGYLAAVVFMIAAAWTPLCAQGGRQLSRAATPAAGPAAAAPAAGDEPTFAPARSVLRTLAGTWHFDIRFAGNFDGPPDASGTRVAQPLFDDLRLQWTETLDHSALPLEGQGIIGFDPQTGRFFSSTLSSSGTSPEFMTGTLDRAEPLVTFNPIALAPDSGPPSAPRPSLALNVLDHDHFTLAPVDRAWRALFTRQP
jgi:hypothetical protein